MLTNADIEMMHDWRDEVVANRRRDITLSYTETVNDEYTGEPIGTEKVDRIVKSVVTEMSGSPERSMSAGILYEKGDIWFSVNIELIEDIADKLTQVTHDGKGYEILATDKKGIGIRNRYEVLGRVIT